MIKGSKLKEVLPVNLPFGICDYIAYLSGDMMTVVELEDMKIRVEVLLQKAKVKQYKKNITDTINFSIDIFDTIIYSKKHEYNTVITSYMIHVNWDNLTYAVSGWTECWGGTKYVYRPNNLHIIDKGSCYWDMTETQCPPFLTEDQFKFIKWLEKDNWNNMMDLINNIK